ncbi:MAG TPA: hypothetical protein VFI04_00235 [Gaiellaceae bacterium]|jgi:hypothetical protein|nr:hypothetical protein [Gaiellaceae bacterium]
MLRLSLRYPNGRSHDITYEGPERFQVGQEFDLHGRRWRVVEIKRPRETRFGTSGRVVTCVPLTESALRRADVG